MKHKICLDNKKVNKLTNEKWCTHFRTSTLVRHAESEDHQKCLKEIALRKDFVLASNNALSKKDEAVAAEIRSVYWWTKRRSSQV